MQPFKPRQKPTEQVPLEESLLVLLRGIKKHSALAGEPGEREFFAKLELLEKTFKGKENAYDIVEAAVGILAQNNERVNNAVARQRLALAKASADLATAAKELASTTADGLAGLEQQISSIGTGDDLEKIKAKLISGVATARAAAGEERKKIGALVSSTVTELGAPQDSGEGPAEGPPVRDQLTGLPVRALAEAELARAHEEAGDCFLVIFIVKRLAIINAKFGFARGDQVLLKVVSHLAHSLPEFRSFFRWAPCAFIGMAPAGMTFRDLRAKVQVIELTRLTPTLEWEGHNAMVPVALDCRVVSVKDFSTLPELFLRLDTFASDV